MNAPESLSLPSWWRGGDFTAKAGWLMSRLGCTYEQACSMLAGRKRKATVRPTVAAYQAQMERRGMG